MKKYCARCGDELETPYSHLIHNGVYQGVESWDHTFLCNLCWNNISDYITGEKELVRRTTADCCHQEDVKSYQDKYGKDSI